VHTLLVLALTQLYDSPAVVAIAQLVATAALGSAVLFFVFRHGVRFRWIAPFFLAFALSPPVAVYTLLVWKDVPFCLLTVFWACLLYALAYRRRVGDPFVPGRAAVVVLAVLLVLVATVRHNGLPYLLVLPGLMLAGGLVPRRQLAALVVLAAVLYVGLEYGIGTLIGAHRNTNYRIISLSVEVNPWAALLGDRVGYYTDDPEGDRRILGAFMDPDTLLRTYSPLGVVPLVYGDNRRDTITAEETRAISRRFLRRAAEIAGGVAAATTIVRLLEPDYARGQQIAPQDGRLETFYVTYPGTDGEVRGYLARPRVHAGKLPGVLVIRENRGLNAHIEDVARRAALEGYVALAPDGLTYVGGAPEDQEKARDVFGQAARGRITADVIAGVVSSILIVFFIMVCTAATLYASGQRDITGAADAARALAPLAGRFAELLFAFGLLNASLLAASILPLSTAQVICEGLGFEAGIDRKFREAPISVDLRNASLEDALNTVAAATRTFFRVTAPQTVVIVPDTPAKRREYEEEIVRTFYSS